VEIGTERETTVIEPVEEPVPGREREPEKEVEAKPLVPA